MSEQRPPTSEQASQRSVAGTAWEDAREAFAAGEFRYVLGASALFAFAQWMERTAVGWLVLEETGSAFLTALAWAVRSAPSAIMGPVAGTLADRVSRPVLLATSAILKGIALVATGILALGNDPSIASLLLLIALSGSTMTINNTALQPLVQDLVGPRRAMGAISLNSLGMRAIGAIGAIFAGVLIAKVGVGETFFVAAGILAFAAVSFSRARARPPLRRVSSSFRHDVWDGLQIVFRIRIVAALLVLMVVVENLGFAFNSVMPVVANKILDVGPEGLGLLGTAAGVGSIFGTAGLALLGNFQRKGLLLLAVVGGFGGLLMAMAATDLFVLVLIITALLGAAMAAVDALEWILLQANVEDEYRGRVIGAWNLAIGLGWLGPILLGGAAEALGVQNALALFGALLLTTGIVAGGSRRLRAA